MSSVPIIDPESIVAEIRQRLPSASVTVETINPEHGSWVIDVRHDGRMVSISWGPLSGFGATDHQAYRDDSNPFGAYDWPLAFADEAVDFATKHLS